MGTEFYFVLFEVVVAHKSNASSGTSFVDYDSRAEGVL